MDLTLVLDAKSGTTLQTQVFEQIRRMILTSRLKPGMALPPSRQIAEKLKVSRNTITLAYDRLVAEGYVESRGTAGTFVNRVLPGLLKGGMGGPSGVAVGSNGELRPEMPSPLLCFAGYPAGQNLASGRPSIDFWVGRSDPSSFPLKAWRRILLRKLALSSVNLTEYGDPAGLMDLRAAIAHHLGRSRGMSVSMNQVIVTSGSQDGLNLVCRLVDKQKHPFFIENPCYQGAAHLFQGFGAETCPIPVDEHGIITELLPRDRSGVLFVTPTHQYPTGATLSLKRRIEILNWAEETNSLVIEDDYDSDFRYDGPPLTSLAGLDRGRRVLYLGTFSKSLGAGLRIGYAVVTNELAKSARVVKCQMNNGQPWLDQAVLAEFLETGEFDRHIRRLRQVYKSRRDTLISALKKHFGDTEICGADGGLHIVWRLPAGSPPAELVQQAARDMGIGVYTLASGGAHDFDRSSRQDMLVIGYSSVNEKDIERAVNVLRMALLQKIV